jgi:hypothetical protein
VLQFALYQHAENVVVAAAEDGARVAAAQGNSTQDGVKRANDMLKAGLGSVAEPPITISAVPEPNTSDPQRVQRITVTVSARLRTIIPWVPFRDPYLPLRAQAQMSKEHFRAQGP